MSDPAKDILDGVATSNRVRAAAWDAFNQAQSLDQLKQVLDGLPLPTEAKAALWDAKVGVAPPPKPTQGYDKVTKGLFGQDIHEWQSANGASESNRPDSSLLGLPPELAITSGLGIGRAIAGEAGGMVSRAYAGAKAATEQAAPAIKYEATKATLEHLGVPSAVAIPIALTVSGLKRGPKTPTSVVSEAEAAGAARVSPPASTPAVPASPVAPGASQSVPTRPAGPQWSPQRVRNEVGMAERRGGLLLTEAQRAEADRLVEQGMAPREAIQTAAGPAAETSAATPSVAPAASAPATAVAPKAHLTAAESQAYTRLRRAGKTHQEAVQAIETQRDLAQRLGTPSPEDVRRSVAERNATGRWRPQR